MISRTLKKQDLIGGGGHCILVVPHDGLPASTSFYTTRAQVRHKRMRSVVQGEELQTSGSERSSSVYVYDLCMTTVSLVGKKLLVFGTVAHFVVT